MMAYAFEEMVRSQADNISMTYTFDEGGSITLSIYKSYARITLDEDTDNITVSIGTPQYCTVAIEDVKGEESKYYQLDSDVEDPIIDLVCNAFVFMHSLSCVSEIQWVIDIILENFAYHRGHPFQLSLNDAFWNIHADTAFEIECDDKAIRNFVKNIRTTGDIRGIVAVANNSNANKGVLMKYTIGSDTLEFMMGHDHSCLLLNYQGTKYYMSVMRNSRLHIKYGLFANMFCVLGCTYGDNIDRFIDEVILTFIEPDDCIADLASFLSKIKYDTQFDVCRTSVYFDDDYYWAERPTTDAQDSLVVNINDFRRACLGEKATVISKCFRGWMARKMYAWNPETSLGKYYVNRDFLELVDSGNCN